MLNGRQKKLTGDNAVRQQLTAATRRIAQIKDPALRQQEQTRLRNWLAQQGNLPGAAAGQFTQRIVDVGRGRRAFTPSWS